MTRQELKKKWLQYTPGNTLSKHIGFLLEKNKLSRPKDLTEFTNCLIIYKIQINKLGVGYEDHRISIINEMMKSIDYINLFESKEFLRQLITIVNEHKKIIRKLA